MGKVSIKCKDLGPQCDFIVVARNEEKLMKKAAKHMAKTHKIVELPPNLVLRAKSVITKID